MQVIFTTEDAWYFLVNNFERYKYYTVAVKPKGQTCLMHERGAYIIKPFQSQSIHHWCLHPV